ncbi:MAG TPA: rhamnulokinase family protein [Terriglobia bacterium]|jgi:rhamnulokinase|nr:rhamnulokinase family protein [Terriglobia bacterium]
MKVKTERPKPLTETADRLREIQDELDAGLATKPGASSLGQAQALRPALIAVDLGAESCRVSLLRWSGDRPVMELVHRFPNGPLDLGGRLRWDLEGILQGVEDGLRACAPAFEAGRIRRGQQGIASIGVDGWAVDYVRLGADGKPLGDPYCYRDERTVEAEREVLARIPPGRLYALTGIQQLRINTLHQLYADTGDGVMADAPWLNLPEYVLHALGGRRVSEYTNATHTQLVDLKRRNWCGEIFAAAGLDLRAAPAIVPSGTCLGRISGPLARIPAFRDTELIAPACHDTASAVAGIPAQGEDWAYISSGTWSLVGTLLDQACTSPDAERLNFTNEGGAGGKVCFLKNVNGMWMLRQCMDSWQQAGGVSTVPELIAAAEKLPAPPAREALLDVDAPDLMLPGNMPQRINAQRKQAGLAPLDESPHAAPAMAGLIFHSLAARYAEVLKSVAEITGKRLRRLYVAGGGGRNAFLNRLTAEKTGLEVHCAAVESSTVGNFAIQLAALESAYDQQLGVKAEAVARWAGILAEAEVSSA